MTLRPNSDSLMQSLLGRIPDRITTHGVDFNARFYLEAGIVVLEKKGVSLNWAPEFAKKRAAALTRLGDFTKEIEGVHIPKVLGQSRENVAVELARGIPLDSNIPEEREQRAQIPESAKMLGLLRYLRVAKTVTDIGWAITDHKRESVFLEPTGEIWIVDPGGVEVSRVVNPDTLSPSDLQQHIQNIKRSEVKEKNGIHDILKGFFYNPVTNDPKSVPPEIQKLVQQIASDSYPGTIDDLLEEVESLAVKRQSASGGSTVTETAKNPVLVNFQRKLDDVITEGRKYNFSKVELTHNLLYALAEESNNLGESGKIFLDDLAEITEVYLEKI